MFMLSVVWRTTPTLVMLAIGSLASEAHAAAGPFQVHQQAADSLAQARALYLQNKVAEALPVFQAVATNEPNNADAHAWLAEAARRLGQFDRAEEAARIGIRSSSARDMVSRCRRLLHPREMRRKGSGRSGGL